MDRISTRSIDVNPKIVTVDGALVLWAERMGHPVTSELVAKALRQYFKTLERTRSYKLAHRRTLEGRECINRQNRESRARLKEWKEFISTKAAEAQRKEEEDR